MQQQWADYRIFWREFRQTFQTTGAVLPSGRALAWALTRFVREAEQAVAADRSAAIAPDGVRRRRILEVGPGTGAVTASICRHMSAGDQLVLVERNEQFVARLRQRIANDLVYQPIADRITLVHAGVEELPENEPFDLIISGLPLNNFSARLVEQIAAKLQRLLADGGILSFFEYVAIRRAKSLVSRSEERKRLREIGHMLDQLLETSEVKRDLVFTNVPPAWVHHVQWNKTTSA